MEKEKKPTEKELKRDLYSRAFLCFTVILVLLIATIAWFIQSKYAEVSGLNLGAGYDGGKGFSLYELKKVDVGNVEGPGDDGIKSYAWELVNNIQLSQPNEVRRYLLVSDSGSTKMKFNTLLPNVPATTSTIEHGTDVKDILDFAYIVEQSNENTKFANFIDLYADTGNTTYLSLTSNAYDLWNKTDTVASDGSNLSGYIFDLYLDKDVCNYYTGATITATLIIE